VVARASGEFSLPLNLGILLAIMRMLWSELAETTEIYHHDRRNDGKETLGESK
jgi:hypothetical protein